MADAKEYRPLNGREIEVLKNQFCTATDWGRVQVAEEFDPQRVRHVHFSGSVRIGAHYKSTLGESPAPVPTGLYHVSLHEVTVGDNVLIRNVRAPIAHYTIEDEAVIDDVGCLQTEGESRFGNGTPVKVVNENGNRSIPIFDRLCSQVAYVLAMYRHRPELIRTLNLLIEAYVKRRAASAGVVGAGARLLHCGVIRNVRIGEGAILDGAARLENGSIRSGGDDPAFVGTGVIARDFIFCEGSRVTDHVTLTRCFVGQSVEIGRGFSAEDSVFFSNSSMQEGEARSVFAGPFTVSHNKSSLLIAASVSFSNAGSGTNQSNHMYRLGPNHQGILERGVKTGSSSYLLWPARVGAFSVVVGRHYSHPDTAYLPFSYLMERDGRTEVHPAMNMANIGIIRDAIKWHQRDTRKAGRKLDRIIGSVMTPYTAGRIYHAMGLLERLLSEAGSQADKLEYQGFLVINPAQGLELYRLALDQYLGHILLHRMADRKFISLVDLRNRLDTFIDLGTGPWVDWGGLIAPMRVVETLLTDVEQGRVDTWEVIETRLDSVLENYAEYEWAWVKDRLEVVRGKKLRNWNMDDFGAVLERWKETTEQLEELRRQDALREFAPSMRIGYGLDGSEAERDGDFEAVCGTLESNAVVDKFLDELREHRRLYEKVTTNLKALK
jgi:hypothetical protein